MNIGKNRVVRVVSPSGPCSKEMLFKSRVFLDKLGFTVGFGENVLKKTEYLAGADDERLSDLVSALDDKNVDIVWLSRGGFGAARLLDKLPRHSSRKEKTIIGYSDSTAIFCWASRFPRLNCLYGPSFSEVHDESLVDYKSLWASLDKRDLSLKAKGPPHAIGSPQDLRWMSFGHFLSTRDRFFPRSQRKFPVPRRCE